MEDGLVLEGKKYPVSLPDVLILVVVEDGLVLIDANNGFAHGKVLILVVVEDGLVHFIDSQNAFAHGSLNPCCSGRWSRTRPYKTLLIINKLKNFTKEIFTFLNRNLTIS